jgi:hypothetical protein
MSCGFYRRIRDQNVAGARAAGGQQFERRRALEVRHAARGEHAHDEFEFGGLHMRPPAVGIAAEQSQRRADIRFGQFRINEQRRRQNLRRILDAIGFERKSRDHNRCAHLFLQQDATLSDSPGERCQRFLEPERKSLRRLIEAFEKRE